MEDPIARVAQQNLDEQIRIETRVIEERVRAENRMDEFITHGIRGLATINGGGAISMLGLMQALAGKDILHSFKPYGVIALLAFVLGLVICTSIFVLRYRVQEEFLRSSDAQASPDPRVLQGLRFSLMFFAIGSVLAGAGMVFAL